VIAIGSGRTAQPSADFLRRDLIRMGFRPGTSRTRRGPRPSASLRLLTGTSSRTSAGAPTTRTPMTSLCRSWDQSHRNSGRRW
jgi:hypothetical protein